MSRWKITIDGKAIRKASIQKLADKLQAEFPSASISVTDASLPESRADRFTIAIGQIDDARGEVECLAEELQSWLDGMPENLQQSGKADDINAAIDELNELTSKLEDAASTDVSFPGMY